MGSEDECDTGHLRITGQAPKNDCGNDDKLTRSLRRIGSDVALAEFVSRPQAVNQIGAVNILVRAFMIVKSCNQDRPILLSHRPPWRVWTFVPDHSFAANSAWGAVLS